MKLPSAPRKHLTLRRKSAFVIIYYCVGAPTTRSQLDLRREECLLDAWFFENKRNYFRFLHRLTSRANLITSYYFWFIFNWCRLGYGRMKNKNQYISTGYSRRARVMALTLCCKDHRLPCMCCPAYLREYASSRKFRLRT